MNFNSNKAGLVCAYSLPRSGSTVLIAELDRHKGVISLPESYFPQVLELMTPTELADVETLAAYFIASSPSGSSLSFEEAAECMAPDDWGRTLANLGLACAAKTGRDIDSINTVIWKTTRLIGRWRLFHQAGGRFILLRRHRYNVFESQFRVAFGIHNRNPIRFALFHQSYEAVFARLPKQDTFQLEYDRIPHQADEMHRWLGISGERWADGTSSLEKTHASKSWHGGLLDDFESKDHVKREKVSLVQRILITAGMILLRPFRFMLSGVRDHYDRCIMNQVRDDAIKILSEKRMRSPRPA